MSVDSKIIEELKKRRSIIEAELVTTKAGLFDLEQRRIGLVNKANELNILIAASSPPEKNGD